MNCPICKSQLIINKRIFCANSCLVINPTHYCITVSPYKVHIITSTSNNYSYIDQENEVPEFKNLAGFKGTIPLDLSKDLLSQVQAYLIL